MKSPIITILTTLVLLSPFLWAEKTDLENVKATAAAQSKYLNQFPRPNSGHSPKADLEGFKSEISPILVKTCVECHGPTKQKGKLRIDTLDPDLVNGKDADWWLEVMGALSNDEMPPPDEDVELAEADRAKVIEWLSGEVLSASRVQRDRGAHSSFRRMTRYEFNYALQDLLGLPQDFATDLPPETVSEEGFRNNSEMLQMTSLQFVTYREIARRALNFATVRGPRPKPLYFGITMDKAGAHYEDWVRQNLKDLKQEAEDGLPPEVNVQLHQDNISAFKKILERMDESSSKKGSESGRRSRRGSTFLNRETGESWSRSFPYGFSLWKPTVKKPVDPKAQPFVMVLPHEGRHQVDLGNHLPDQGMVRIRFRANRASADGKSFPSLRLSFGYRPSNNSSREYALNQKDIAITAPPGKPQFYEWLVPMDDLERNPYLRKSQLGRKPNPSEFFVIRNIHQGSGHEEEATVHIDYIEVTAPHLTEWPPKSHQEIFFEQSRSGDEVRQARAVLANFLPKAWRRPVSEEELAGKVALFKKIRPSFDDFQEASIEVLAGVLASPNFLYLTQSSDTISESELASRLSFFLWSSQPDEALLSAAARGELHKPGVLARHTERLLADPRSERFAQQFTHQWLGMELLDFLQVDEEVYPDFSEELKRAMQREPIAFFQYILQEDRSIMDFLHADYTLANQTLAEHYGLEPVYGNHFQRVALTPGSPRGGLLAQAGLLAMNSDGKDSHPLKRGIWLLESILHDPPPPPPPAVPEIDLADPAILKMTLKERMEDHRNKPACASCHAKIDPWGIAFEEFDAVGSWRDEINGKPVDATSSLHNQQELAGMQGLKHYLLANRQDQFSRAMVHKLASYALGRPLGFSDRAQLEQLTANLRQEGDGLRTLIRLLVESDLFQTN